MQAIGEALIFEIAIEASLGETKTHQSLVCITDVPLLSCRLYWLSGSVQHEFWTALSGVISLPFFFGGPGDAEPANGVI